jgi:hypothetical protein
MLPAASQATSVGWLKLSTGTPDPAVRDPGRRRPRTAALLPPRRSPRPAAQGHEDAAGGVELGDHPGGAVHDPEVVLGIDPHALRKQEDVGAPGGAGADLAQELAGAIELVEARAAVDVGARGANRGVRAAAAGVDPDVARGRGGHAGHFTEVDVGRQLQKIAGGFERDFFLLGEERAGELRAGQHRTGEDQREGDA